MSWLADLALTAAGRAALLLYGFSSLHGIAAAQPTGRAVVLNPDLAGLHAAADGRLLAWGSDASVWTLGSEPLRVSPASTPHHGRIRAMAHSGQQVVAVGDGGLLLHAANDGVQWHANPAAEGQGLLDVDCQQARCVAVGLPGKVLISEDGGQRWRAAPASPGVLSTVRAGAPGRWWAGDAEGRVWLSRDGGLQWQRHALGRTPQSSATESTVSIDALAVDGRLAVIATSDGRLHQVDEDTDKTQLLHRAARGSYTRIQALPAKGSWVAIGAQGACAWRAAQGAWRACDVPPRRLLRGLASSPDGQHWVVVGEAGLLLHSQNQGRQWQTLQATGLDAAERRDLEAVTWSPAHRGFVAVGAAGLVLRSDASGRQWTVAHSAPQHYVHDIATTPGGELLAGLSYRTLARSSDGGRTWRSHRFTALQDPAFLFNVHADPHSGALVAAGGQGSLMVARDGRHWRHESLGHGRDYLGLMAHPDEPLVLLYGTGGVATRVDTAQGRWHSVKLPGREPLYGGFTSAGGDLWLVGEGGVLLHSADTGETWSRARLGGRTLRTGLAVGEGRVLLAAGDGGTLWRTLLPGSPGAPGSFATNTTGSGDTSANQTWLRIATPDADWRWLQQAADGQTLWLGGSGGQLARSTDRGLTWTPQALPTTAAMRAPVYDAARQQWWMAGRDGTLLHSGDDGASWQRVPTQTQAHLKGVWVDPASGALLLHGARLVHWTPGTAP